MNRSIEIQVSEGEPHAFSVRDTHSNQLVFVDPGLDLGWCKTVLKSMAAKCIGIFLTSGRFETCGRAAELSFYSDAPVFCHKNALPLLQRLPQEARNRCLCGVKIPKISNLVGHENIGLQGNISVRSIEIPGSDSGDVCYQIENRLFVGSHFERVKDKLPRNAEVFPSHGKSFHFDELFGEKPEMK